MSTCDETFKSNKIDIENTVISKNGITTSLTKENENAVISKNDFISSLTKIFVNFIKSFIKFYGIRFLVSFSKILIKYQFNVNKISLLQLNNILFNNSNLRTGLFLSAMPGLFNLFEFIYKNTNYFNFINEEVFTFFNAFITSFIGTLFAEKAKILNFIILSVFMRSIHSLIVVWLNKNKLPTRNKYASWFAIFLASLGLLFLTLFYPQYKSTKKAVDKYALYTGTEAAEFGYYRDLLKFRFADD